MIAIEPILVDRQAAADLLAISTATRERHVSKGTIPKPRMIGSRAAWLVEELREAARKLPVSDLLPPPTRQ